LDVGANTGQYAKDVRSFGYRGRIVSFEPQSAAFQHLKRAAAADPQWQALNLALGASEAVAEINLAGNSESSSLLPMEPRHVKAYPPSAYVGKEEIRIVSLDSLRGQLMTSDDKLWLKVDVQGLEMSVLAGAEHTLGQVEHIEMELSLVSLYTGSLLFSEAIEALRLKHYQLIALEEAFLDGENAQALQLNGIFKRE
jgi:FkbM family methyltransferase